MNMDMKSVVDHARTAVVPRWLCLLASCMIPSRRLRHLVRSYATKRTLGNYDRRRRQYALGLNSYVGQGDRELIASSTVVGKYCSIACDVTIGVANHPLDALSTHTFVCHMDEGRDYGEIKVPRDRLMDIPPAPPVVIGNDVRIGVRAVILSGVHIGDGAVVGAAAVVVKDVPPYAIVAGVPARVIRYRFAPDICRRLQASRWWDYPQEFIAQELPFGDVSKCLEILEANADLLLDRRETKGEGFRESAV